MKDSTRLFILWMIWIFLLLVQFDVASIKNSARATEKYTCLRLKELPSYGELVCK